MRAKNWRLRGEVVEVVRLVWCCILYATHKNDGVFVESRRKAPQYRDIASIFNDESAKKARFYVAGRVQHYTRPCCLSRA